MMRADMRNLIFCIGGALFGLIIGFWVANKNPLPVNAGNVNPNAATEADAPEQPGQAGPLDPSQLQGGVPANHPPLDNSNASGGNTVATSPQLQNLMDAADRNPKNFDAQMQIAIAYYQQNALDKAELYLQRALAVKPDDPDALAGMGTMKYEQTAFVAAGKYFQRALAVEPDDPDVRTDLGSTYFQRTPPDYDRAIAEYRKSLAIDPNHERSWQNIAAAALRKGDKATAKEAVEQLTPINPNNPALASLRSSLN